MFACTISSINGVVGGGSRRGEGGDHRKATQAPHFDLSRFTFFVRVFRTRLATGGSQIVFHLSVSLCAFLNFRFLWAVFFHSFSLLSDYIDGIVVTFESAMCDDS